MQFIKLLTAVGLLACTSQVYARADLSVVGSGPNEVAPGAVSDYRFTVSNIGNRRARNSMLNITLPSNSTLSATMPSCSVAGNLMACDLGNMRPNASQTIVFDLNAPSQEGTIMVLGQVSTTKRENSLSNNSSAVSTQIESPTPDSFPIISETDLLLKQCVSTSGALTFDQCTAGSLMTHAVTLNTDGSIQTNDPNVQGNWVQNSAQDIELRFTLSADNSTLSVFTGQATSDTCFEGAITFHQGSGYGAWQGCRN